MQAKKDAPAHQGNSLRKSNHLRVIVARAAKAASPGLTAASGKGLAPSALRPCNSIRATAAPREFKPLPSFFNEDRRLARYQLLDKNTNLPHIEFNMVGPSA